MPNTYTVHEQIYSKVSYTAAILLFSRCSPTSFLWMNAHVWKESQEDERERKRERKANNKKRRRNYVHDYWNKRFAYTHMWKFSFFQLPFVCIAQRLSGKTEKTFIFFLTRCFYKYKWWYSNVFTVVRFVMYLGISHFHVHERENPLIHWSKKKRDRGSPLFSSYCSAHNNES